MLGHSAVHVDSAEDQTKEIGDRKDAQEKIEQQHNA
jgi:hypothetical protein